jgi:hypothetical protein
MGSLREKLSSREISESGREEAASVFHVSEEREASKEGHQMSATGEDDTPFTSKDLAGKLKIEAHREVHNFRRADKGARMNK